MPSSSDSQSMLPVLNPGRLPNGLDPFADESLAGFVMRLAVNHEYSSPMQLLRPLELGLSTLRQAAREGTAHPFMAEYLALTPAELDKLSSGQGTGSRVLGHELDRDLVVLGGRKLCPVCIAEQPYHRAYWDLTVMTVCPVHAVRLLSHCTECHRALNWKVGPVTCCSSQKCAADLRWAEAAHVPEGEMGGVRGLHRLLASGSCPEFADAVRRLSVSDQILLAFHLGCYARGRNAMVRPTNFAADHADEVHLVLNEGWRVCGDWPSAFHELLDRRLLTATSRKRYGIRKHFGTLRSWLERNGEPYARLIGAELTRYIVAHPEFATRAPEIKQTRATIPLEQQSMTMAEARDALGVAFETVHTLAVAHDLYLVPPTGSGAPALLRAVGVHALQKERARLLTKEEVRDLLGSGKATVDKLRRAGLLPTEADYQDPDGVRYPIAGVEALLEDLESRVQPRAAKPKKAVTMATIARQVPMPDFDVCDIVVAVRAGEIAPVALDAKARGLHRILFKQADVARFVAALARTEKHTLSIKQAADELGVKEEVARHWARAGLLTTVAGSSPTESGRRVTEAALAAFRREYVTAAEFARVHRLGKKLAGRNLIEFGIEAVSGPSVDGARQFLFRCADLAGFDVSKLVSGRSKLRPDEARQRRLTHAGAEGFKYRVGKALRREFGEDLIRHYHCYRDDASGVVVQVMTSGNGGVHGCYQYLFTEKHRVELGAAVHGYVAFAFADRPDFLLVPWAEIMPLFPTMRRHETSKGPFWRFWIRADGQGRLSPFGEYARSLAVEGDAR